MGHWAPEVSCFLAMMLSPFLIFNSTQTSKGPMGSELQKSHFLTWNKQKVAIRSIQFSIYDYPIKKLPGLSYFFVNFQSSLPSLFSILKLLRLQQWTSAELECSRLQSPARKRHPFQQTRGEIINPRVDFTFVTAWSVPVWLQLVSPKAIKTLFTWLTRKEFDSLAKKNLWYSWSVPGTASFPTIGMECSIYRRISNQ